jgi:flagellar biogenesis protein FliO
MNQRTAAFAVMIALGVAGISAAADPAKAPAPAKGSGPATYPSPVVPEPPSVAPLLLRLVAATGAVMVLAGLAAWTVRRAGRRPVAAGGDSRLRLVGTLSLGNGTSLHLLECCGRRFVAGVGPTGFRSLAPLPESFDNELDVLAALG